MIHSTTTTHTSLYNNVNKHIILVRVYSLGLYPYGGATYAISKAMLDAVGRDTWEKYMYRLQCSNADINVMTTIFSAGYSIHQYDHVFNPNFAPHHVHTVKEQFDTFLATRQPKDVLEAACSHANITAIVGEASFHHVCKGVSVHEQRLR